VEEDSARLSRKLVNKGKRGTFQAKVNGVHGVARRNVNNRKLKL